MYMSVRKPPLSSGKVTGKPNTLRKSESETIENNNMSRGVIPSVPKTVPPRNYTRRSSSSSTGINNNNNNNIPFLFNSHRGGTSPYQTTNTLFTGNSPLQTQLGEIGSEVNNNNNNNNNNNHGIISNGEDPGSPISNGHSHVNNNNTGVPRSSGNSNNNNNRGIIGRRPPVKSTMKRNASDNVAAVLGGSTLMNGGDRWGNNNNNNNNNNTRKVFSGPPSTRVPASHNNNNNNNNNKDILSQRPHPPGSGGTKLGARALQFALNANSTQRLSPIPPRPTLAFGQMKNNLETATHFSQRNIRSKQHETIDPFGTTQILNGVSSQFHSDSDTDIGGIHNNNNNNNTRMGNKSITPPFALASVKLQQLNSTQLPVSPVIASEPSAPYIRRSSLSSVSNNNINKNNNNNNNNLQYDFRVVASTGKGFNSPIKLTVGVGSLQGLRPTMEDEHFIRLNAAAVAGQPVSLIGILDGHCGKRVAELASKHVPDNFVSHSALGENNALAFVESIIQADRAIFHALGKGNNNNNNSNNNNNNSFISSGSGGSTLIAAAVHGRMLYVACLGDARAVLYDGEITIPMSEDHKPTNNKESIRIQQCGGFVQFGRVCGILAVSRALGDFEFKFNGNRFIANRELMVSNIADVRQINLTDSSKFLLMACDGLWDVVENEEATQFVRDFLSYTPDVGSSPEATKRALNNCCQKLAEFAIDRGSTDNVSVMLLFFHNVAEVVAGFDKPVGAIPSNNNNNNTSNNYNVHNHYNSNVSPRLSGPSRGFDGSYTNNNNYNYNNYHSGGTGGARRTSLGANSSWYGRNRSIW